MGRNLLGWLAPLLLAATAFAQGRVVEESFQRDPGPLDFIFGEGHEQNILQSLAGDALVGLDPAGRPVPRLAAGWTARERTLRFRLRPGATFMDGSAVRAEDVVWTFQAIQNDPKASPTKRAILDGVAVSGTGDSVTVTSAKPAERLLRELGRIPVARKGHATLGSGPFACERQGLEWRLTARPHFLRPRSPGLRFRMMPEEHGVLEALKKGWLHIGVPPARKGLEAPPGYTELRQPLHAQILVWSRARGALNWVETWRDEAFPGGFLGNKGTPRRGLWPEGLGHRHMRIASAKGPKPGRLEIQYAAGDDYVQKLLMALRVRAAKDGVELDLRPVEAALLFQHLMEGRFELACAVALYDPHPWSVLELLEPKGPMNFSGWGHPRLEDLLGRLRSAEAPAWQELQAAWAEAPGALPLVDFTSVVWVDARLVVTPSPMGLYLTTPGAAGWRWTR